MLRREVLWKLTEATQHNTPEDSHYNTANSKPTTTSVLKLLPPIPLVSFPIHHLQASYRSINISVHLISPPSDELFKNVFLAKRLFLIYTLVLFRAHTYGKLNLLTFKMFYTTYTALLTIYV